MSLRAVSKPLPYFFSVVFLSVASGRTWMNGSVSVKVFLLAWVVAELMLEFAWRDLQWNEVYAIREPSQVADQ